ncbi:MAG: hypothetical protein QM709_16395 [Spongiibacteraceae bacterium]
MMNTAEKATLVENTLTRAAEQIGDITPAVMEIYYREHPEALAAFEAHGLGKRSHLEGMMIENSLHCLMHWLQSPGEIEILLSGSVPHHRDTLQVTPQLYSDFLETTAEVIAQTIPPANEAEAAVWNDVRQDLRDVIKQHSGC